MGIDVHVHDTYFVVAHFHYLPILFVAALLTLGAAKLAKLIWVMLSN